MSELDLTEINPVQTSNKVEKSVTAETDQNFNENQNYCTSIRKFW